MAFENGSLCNFCQSPSHRDTMGPIKPLNPAQLPGKHLWLSVTAQNGEMALDAYLQCFPFRALTWTESASCANQISWIIISLQTTKINHDAGRTSRFVEGPKIVQSCSKKFNNSWHSFTHSHFNNIYSYGFSRKMKANAPSDFHLKIQILLSFPWDAALHY